MNQPGMATGTRGSAAQQAAIAAAAAVPLLLWAAGPHAAAALVLPAGLFLLLHGLLEMLSMVACLSVATVAVIATDERRARDGRLLGASLALAVLFDSLHVVSYAGLPDLLSANSPQKAIVFWLLGRYAVAGALCLWCLPPPAGRSERRWRRAGTLLAGAGLLAVAAVALVDPHALPTLFVSGHGLTPLKTGLEWGVVALLLLAAGLQRRAPAARAADEPVLAALLVMAIGETFFVLMSAQVTDAANLLGHVYKLLGNVLLWRALFVRRLRRPFQALAQAHAELAAQHSQISALIERAPAGIVVLDDTGRIQLVNEALEAMFGHSRDQLLGQPSEILLPPHLRAEHVRLRQQWLAQADRLPPCKPPPMRGLHRNGDQIDLAVALGGGFGSARWRLTAHLTDVSHRRALEMALAHRASHDTLTGLPNRAHFASLLQQALSHARVRGETVAVAVIDIDDFKAVNDCLGSAAGDQALQALVQRLQGWIGPQERLGRLGSDEFALLIPACGDALLLQDRIQGLARALTQGLSAGAGAATGGWPLTASVGAARWPDDANDADHLLRCADLALSVAKRQGRGGAQLFDQDLGARQQLELRVYTRLQAALQQGGLQLHYQPQVALDGGRILAFEALLRWTDAELGQVAPSVFIPVAERTGLIMPIGERVLALACAQLADWRAAGLQSRISINLSPHQFQQQDLAERVAQALQQHGLQPSSLAVEITESCAMADPRATVAQLRSLAALGVEVHLDDFGTGHSSLAWLQSFPVSAIKIDRAFVQAMGSDAAADGIVRTVLALADTLDCGVIAEGVEEGWQCDRLRGLGCALVQGWWFSQAVPAAGATALLRAGRLTGGLSSAVRAPVAVAIVDAAPGAGSTAATASPAPPSAPRPASHVPPARTPSLHFDPVTP